MRKNARPIGLILALLPALLLIAAAFFVILGPAGSVQPDPTPGVIEAEEVGPFGPVRDSDDGKSLAPRYGVFQLLPGAGALKWTYLEGGEELPERFVLLVHGLDEPGNIWDDLAPALLEADHDVARFDYPNDQAIADSGARLASSLARLKAQGVERVDLVCHSMGGLVARETLTSPDFYAGDARGDARLPAVDHLILVGVPNDGAPLAKLRIITEMKERGARWWEDDEATLDDLLKPLSGDGRGQAGIDLMPGSDFLERLNARPLPEGAEITVIAGELTPAQEEDIERLVNMPLARALLGREGSDWVADGLNTLRTSVGDGVVPLDSALLAGVDDVVTLRANHRALLREPPLGRRIRESMDVMTPRDEPPAIDVILERVGER